MADWATFAGITGVVLLLLLVLSRLTQSAFSDSDDGDGLERTASSAPDPTEGRDRSSAELPTETDPEAGSDPADATEAVDTDVSLEAGTDLEAGIDADEDRGSASTASDAGRVTDDRRQSGDFDPESLSTGELLANVALSQGLFAIVLIGAVIYTGIPADALGIEFSQSYLEQGLTLGTAFGLVLYVANEIGAAASTWFGFDHDEDLRELLAPDALQGWVVLLVVVLPIIAIFEELLFRAALIGVLSAGFDISPWLLAAVSSVAFAVGHGMQGSVGVVVTGLLGFVLAAIFVVTESLLTVVVAHYLINALEFAVHEGIGFEWARTLES